MMWIKNFSWIIFSITCIAWNQSWSQCTAPVNFQHQKNIPSGSPLFQHYMTARRDTALSKPFLYTAGKGSGLIIHDISNINAPVLLSTVPSSLLANLDVNSITQSGSYLYLALGDIFSATAQKSGMAIIDVSTPASPLVKSVYSYTANSGAGYVALEGNYAYLAAMQNGLLVFDVSNPSSILLVSVFKPSVNFPVNNPGSSDQLKINARSMVVKNNILYLCYDAGGVRIINTSNKNNLVETGRYSNPLLNARPRAYNNLVLNDTLIYVTADYCGMEILNVKDTSHITQVGWWNPWKCETPANTWFNSPGHTSEIEFDPQCQLVFMSAGRTDLLAVNVSNPLVPDSCSQFGSKADSMGTWGLGRYRDQVYLAYISTWPFYIPFRSEWSGIKIINYSNSCVTGFNKSKWESRIKIYPNPASEELNIENTHDKITELSLIDFLGREVVLIQLDPGENKYTLDLRDLAAGFYNIRIISAGDLISRYFVKTEK